MIRTSIRPRARVGLIVAAGAAALGLGAAAAFVWHLAQAPAGAQAAPVPVDPALDPPAPAQALVHVSGAVAQPGLYRLSTGARVADAIAAAGGVTGDADLGRLPDMAETIHDGKQVNVPFARSGTGGAANGAFRPAPAQRVDVNSATVTELAAVPGMPLGLPEAIVDARAQFGPFQSLSQLKTILGLDGPTFSAVRSWLRAGRSLR